MNQSNNNIKEKEIETKHESKKWLNFEVKTFNNAVDFLNYTMNTNHFVYNANWSCINSNNMPLFLHGVKLCHFKNWTSHHIVEKQTFNTNETKIIKDYIPSSVPTTPNVVTVNSNTNDNKVGFPINIFVTYNISNDFDEKTKTFTAKEEYLFLSEIHEIWDRFINDVFEKNLVFMNRPIMIEEMRNMLVCDDKCIELRVKVPS